MSYEGDTIREDHEIDRMDQAKSARDTIRAQRDAEVYRAMFDTVDTSHFEHQEGAREMMAQGLNAALVDATKDVPAKDLPKEQWDSLMEIADLLVRRQGAISGAATKAKLMLDDYRYFPPSRVRDAEQVLSEAQSTLQAQELVTKAALESAGSELLEVARPAVREGEEVTARTDARMLLDGAEKPTDVSRRIADYLRGGDENSVAGLLADPRWLRSYYIGRGWTDHLDQVEPLLRATIAETARNSANNTRRAAGMALAGLHRYQGALDATNSMARTMDPRRKTV